MAGKFKTGANLHSKAALCGIGITHSHATVFQTNRWILVLQEKLSRNTLPDTVEDVHREKEIFENERNATIDAMLQCRNEGEQILEEVSYVMVNFEVQSNLITATFSFNSVTKNMFLFISTWRVHQMANDGSCSAIRLFV